MNNYPFFLYLIIMAIVTYLIRMLPLVLIKKKITNRFLLSFLHYVPYSVLTVMTIPAVFYATGSTLTALVGFVIALFFALKGKGLPIVAAVACGGVLITEIILTYII